MLTLLHDLLDHRADVSPDSPALEYGDERWTFLELRRWSLACARALADAGVRRHDRVLISAHPAPVTVAAIFAASRLGALYVVTGDRAPLPWLGQVARDCSPRLVLTDRPGAEAELDGVPVLGLRDLPGQPSGRPPACPAISVDPAALVYARASGAPRGLIRTHQQMLFSVHAIQRRLAYTDRDTVFSSLPLSADYGVYQVLLACLTGARLIIAGAEDTGPALARRLDEHHATVLPLTPPLAATLALIVARTGPRPASLRMVTTAGRRMPDQLARQLRTLMPGLALVSVIGSADAAVISIGDPDEDLHLPDACGRALPDTELAVIGDDGEPLPSGEIGELAIYGPHAISGYWGEPSEPVRGGVDRFGRARLLTRDQGCLGPDGHLYLVGRADDVYWQNGVRVVVAELERLVMMLPGVRRAAVLPSVGDRGAVLVISGDASPEGVLTQLAARFDAPGVPLECHVIDDVALGPDGEIDKRWLLGVLPPPPALDAAPSTPPPWENPC